MISLGDSAYASDVIFIDYYYVRNGLHTVV